MVNKVASSYSLSFLILLLLEGVILTSILAGFGSGLGIRILTILLLVPIGGLVAFALPKLSLTTIFLGVYSLDWLSRVLGVLPTQVRWLPEGMIYISVVFLFVRRFINGNLTLRKTPIDPYLIGLIVVGLLSMVVNSGPFFTTLSGFRNLLRPLLLFYLMVNLKLDNKYLKRLVILLIILELLQIPITLIQYSLFGGGDQASGTLGFSSSQMTVMLATVFMSLFYGLAIVCKSGLNALLGSLLFFLILFSEGKAGFFVVPLMVLFLFGTNFLLSARPEIKASALKYLTLILIVFTFVYGLILWLAPVVIPQSEITSFILELGKIFERYEAPLSKTNGIPRSRLGDIQFAWNLISQEPHYTLLGYGPGEASPGIQGLANGDLYQRYAQDPTFIFGDVSAQYTLYSFTQISATLQEFGVSGLIIYLLMLLSIFRMSRKFANRPGIDPFWQGINLGFSGALFAFIAYTVYYRVWYWEAPAYVFWGLAAVIFTLDSLSKTSKGTVSIRPDRLTNE